MDYDWFGGSQSACSGASLSAEVTLACLETGEARIRGALLRLFWGHTVAFVDGKARVLNVAPMATDMGYGHLRKVVLDLCKST
jgi:hypothetical protein